MEVDEILLPVTKPETEWVRGRARQKVSPFAAHAYVQAYLAALLVAWAKGRGKVGTEWRFRIEVPGEPRRPLVPEISYVAYARMIGFTDAELQVPPFAPNVAIEILSPDDEPADIADKTATLLMAGSDLVLLVDPELRVFGAHDSNGFTPFEGDAVFKHDALPGFEVQLPPFFSEALDLPF